MTTQRSRDPAVQMLLDRIEIHDLIVRYGRAVDRLDEELLQSVFHGAAAAEYGVFDGPARAFVEQVIPGLRAGFSATLHTVANEIAEIDGDRATGEAHIIASCAMERDGEPCSPSSVEGTLMSTSAATAS